MVMACLYYKDLNTGKLRRTFATPVAVTKDGPLGIDGLRLENRASSLWIPHYCLVGEALAWFHTLREKRALLVRVEREE